MYCPKCGQQQISDEMRFCSRCGLALSGLAEWIAGSGMTTRRLEQTEVSLPSPRRKGMRRAAKLMFLSGVLFFVFLLFSLAFDEGAFMIVPILVFFVSLVLMLYARLFSDKISPVKYQDVQMSGLGSVSRRDALPAPSNIPIPANRGGQQVRTNELAQPPSVTENTTRLLDNE